jgi:Tfp pilus assembly protein PilN
MSTKLNLASDPFRNRVLPWTVTGLIALFSIVALIFIAQSTFRTNAKIAGTQRDVNELKSQLETVSKQAKAVETALAPEQKRELKYAHGLVDRKRFSWSQLFADLEGALPGEIRVTRIVVKSVGMDGGRPAANLTLIVDSKSPTTVTQMIQDMESEGVFHAELTTQNPQRGKGETGSEYELDVHYLPRAYAIDRAAPKRIVDTAGEGGKTQ